MTLHSEIDDLFKLPLAGFTAARNSLASRLKREGRTDEADEVKALPKPSATAWAVNQLFWQQRSEIDGLLSIGGKLREAQMGKAADLRGLLEKRRRMLSDATDRAAKILSDAGHAPSRDATRRIAITLESLSTGAGSNLEPGPGRLTADLEPLGFEGLAALMDGRKLEPAKVLQFRRVNQEKKGAEDAAARRAQASEAVTAAEKSLTAAQRDAGRAEAALAKVHARAEALEEQKRELEARWKKAQEEAQIAGSAAKKAVQGVAEAERVLARAREALDQAPKGS